MCLFFKRDGDILGEPVVFKASYTLKMIIRSLLNTSLVRLVSRSAKISYMIKVGLHSNCEKYNWESEVMCTKLIK